MRLSHVRVSNHRAIPDVDLAVRGHLVLIGPNETGKSSFLRLLDAVFNGNRARLHAVLPEGAFNDLDEPILCTAVLVDPDERQKAALADDLEVGDDGSYRLTVQVTSVFDPAAGDVEVTRNVVKDGRDFRATSAYRLSEVGLAFLPATRSPDRELSRGQTSALRALLRGVDLADERDSIEEQVRGLHDLLDGAAPLKALRTELAAQLARLSPRDVAVDEVTLRLATMTSEDLLADVDVRLASDGQERSLTSQSDGFRALATVAIQMLAKDGTSIVAVDEPDTHLHPTAQRRMGRLLSSGRPQAVVATHSSSILAQFDPMDVVAFTAAGRSRQLPANPFQGRAKDHPRWWAADRLEPLTARAVLLVEGIADRVVVESAATALGIDLDRLGVSVVEFGGAGEFSGALRLFGPAGFNIPLGLLVDEQEAADVAGYLGVDEADIYDHGVRVCRQDLEHQYVTDLGAHRVHDCLVGSGEFSRASLPDLDSAEDPNQAMIGFCGGKTKTRAALALAAELTAEDAEAIEPVASALRHVTSL